MVRPRREPLRGSAVGGTVGGGGPLGLFGRARSLIKGLATPPESAIQYYNVVCPLGHRVRGQRTEGYQALRCPVCGEGVFVLPIAALPDPGPRAISDSPRRTINPGAPRAVEEGPIELRDAEDATIEVADAVAHADAEISWEDDEPTASPPADPPPSSPRPTPAKRPRPERTRAPRPTPAAETGGAPPSSPGPRGRFVEVDSPRSRNRWNPLWIFAAVSLVVVSTIALRVWRGHQQGLPQVAELGKTEGIPALETGDFERAHQILAPAKRAVDSLGGQVEDADLIRQAADEAALYVNLASSGLEEILDEAKGADPNLWASSFKTKYRGAGILFDTRIRSTPDDPERRYEIDYVVLPMDEAVNFRPGGARPTRSARIEFKGFELFELARPKLGDAVVFGARLESFTFDPVENGWIIRLEPQSGLFVKFHRALESLGWPSAIPSPEIEESRGP